MSRLVILILVVMATLAACASNPPAPSPSQPAASPSAPASDAPPSADPSPSVVASPEPTAVPSAAPTDPPSPAPVATPRPTATPAAVKPSVEDLILLAGVRSDLIDCHPVREDLPANTHGAIECGSTDPAVDRVGFYLFDGTVDLRAAYNARMDAENVPRDTAACTDAEGESAYVPGDGEIDSRHGCFINAQGFANYRAMVPGNLLYIGVLGRNGDMAALRDFAWLGNQDTPGMPTLWIEPAE